MGQTAISCKHRRKASPEERLHRLTKRTRYVAGRRALEDSCQRTYKYSELKTMKERFVLKRLDGALMCLT
jgi:hypothetical protein